MNSSNNISGIINIYKEKGYTSHDVVNVVRKTLGGVKAGHTGTLDPEAEGVLPICIGKATKLADYIAASVKVYKAELTLGITTTTEDHTGEVVLKRPVENIGLEQLKRAAEGFVGEYYQKPPMYSAIRVNGKRLYELARQGVEVERKERLIHIYKIEDIALLPNNKAQLTVTCSKGTYIRTLCKDIGEALGCGAHMSALLRCASGDFTLKSALKLGALKALAEENRLNEALMPMEEALKAYKHITVSAAADKYLENGNKISFNYCSPMPQAGDIAAVFDKNNEIVGIYKATEDCIRPVAMLR